MATGIRDKVAIIGMGCTKFGERWDVGAEELMVEAFRPAVHGGNGRRLLDLGVRSWGHGHRKAAEDCFRGSA